MFAFGKESIHVLTNINDEQNNANFFQYNLPHWQELQVGNIAIEINIYSGWKHKPLFYANGK